jgi:hypothetical protein
MQEGDTAGPLCFCDDRTVARWLWFDGDRRTVCRDLGHDAADLAGTPCHVTPLDLLRRQCGVSDAVMRSTIEGRPGVSRTPGSRQHCEACPARLRRTALPWG